MAKRRFRSRGRFTRLRRRRRGGNRRTKRFVKAIVRRMCETKYAVESGGTNVDGATGYEVQVTPTFAQGVDKNMRLGNHIKYKYFQIRMTVGTTIAGVNTPEYNLVRAILWVPRTAWAPVAGSALNQNNLFIQPSTLSSINNNGCRVLMDKTWYLARYTQGLEPMTYAPFKFVKKKFKIFNDVNFEQATEVIPSDWKDKFILTVVTNSPAGSSNLLVSWNVRVSFYDM